MKRIYVYAGYAQLVGKWIYEVRVGEKICVFGVATSEARAWQHATLA